MSRVFVIVFALFASITFCRADSGKWFSKAIGGEISYTVRESKNAIRDFNGDLITVVYLERLNLRKIGRNRIVKDVAWLNSQGYRVIEIDYANHANAKAPAINADIVALNDSIASGSFCGHRGSSKYQSYVLFEGYRISRNIPYFKDDPTVYNTPSEYIAGDMLNMDIIYPANPSVKVPIILSFSYSNSYATYDAKKKSLTGENKNQRLNLNYTLAGFDDSFLEGAPANGVAWAIADHPKYCPWGKGKPIDGPNDAYKSFQTNPDAARKVKSAVRTLRAMGTEMGLSGKVGIYGFSRGSTAGSLAVGDRQVPDFKTGGFHGEVSDQIQAAALGPGVFDYTNIYHSRGDGDTNMEVRCPWVWGSLEQNRLLWETMGASYLVESSATSPVLFFYNTTDEYYYQEQVKYFQKKLASVGVRTYTIKDYGTGHSVPGTTEVLTKMYSFFTQYLQAPPVSKRISSP